MTMKFRMVLLLLALSTPAWAYLDPVTGNILVQFFLVLFTSVALGFNRLKLWVLGLLGKSSEKEPRKDEPQKEADPERTNEKPAEPE